MPSILRQMTIASRAADKARRATRRKEQMSDLKKLTKHFAKDGKQFSVFITHDGYSLTSITAPPSPDAANPNEWDEELLK